MDMKIYHCQDPAQNPLPAWLRGDTEKAAQPEKASDPVALFKQNPDAFFPDFTSAKRPKT